MTEDRRLTDADVQALADEFEARMVHRFYSNLGSGVWALVWKTIIFSIVAIAAYGAVKGFK